jgi:cytochrome b6-f complex iron-sulfur subunit
MKRRQFLNKLAVGTASSAGLVAIAATVSEILPPDTRSYSIARIGHIEDYPLNEFTYIPDKKIYIFRNRQNIRVISAICTHLGCTINNSEMEFHCPCHGSRYDAQGVSIMGPASRPLDRLKVEVNKDGEISVNFEQKTNQDFKL